jgi:hypothetical protein
MLLLPLAAAAAAALHAGHKRRSSVLAPVKNEMKLSNSVNATSRAPYNPRAGGFAGRESNEPSSTYVNGARDGIHQLFET